MKKFNKYNYCEDIRLMNKYQLIDELTQLNDVLRYHLEAAAKGLPNCNKIIRARMRLIKAFLKAKNTNNIVQFPQTQQKGK